MFKELGGEEVINKLVDDFYHIMSTDPEARDCFATHKDKDIQDSAHKLKYFLIGWTGGPPLYMEKFGHPKLRMRHFPFSIGDKEAQQWLYCMDKALKNSGISKKHQKQLMEAFENLTKIIKNRA